ncbi:MAG: hypothetical protein NTW01_00900 [Gammaproteobacteria bacterium]|jgi:hypothetical protein|uniref:hypothetical protein n=1 Tax=Nevskia sp. TaxID=1929292 RepID=UPI004035A88E|nr:hypothetical protein [Gammaproteobacteria bacterium]
MLKGLARGVKDGALALSLKAFVNDKLSAYGEIVDVTIDTAVNRLTARAMLKGERDPVTVTVERYEIESEGEERFIKLKTFTSSRSWLTQLLNKLLADKRYKIPTAVSKLL